MLGRLGGKACSDADVGDIGNPNLVQPSYVHSLDQVGINRKMMVTVRSGNPLTLDSAEQIALLH